MKIKNAFIFARCVLVGLFLSVFGISSLFGWWFGTKNYYEIQTKDDFYYALGEPRNEGEYTTFNKWPENLDWRIKTKLIVLIKNVGPLSPDEQLQAIDEQLKVIFKNAENSNLINSKKLAKAKAVGLSDSEIYDYLRKKDPAFSDAFSAGFSLERICIFFDKVQSKDGSLVNSTASDQQLKAIFKNVTPNIINSKKLSEARAAGYSDANIYGYLIRENPSFFDAFFAGISLEKICDFFEKKQTEMYP